MRDPELIVLPRSRIDPLEHDLAHVDAAIELVRRGSAVRVRLAGLSDPDSRASVALARAQAAGLEFVIDRGGAASTLTIGPRRSSTEPCD
jgi:hypothetical protein